MAPSKYNAAAVSRILVTPDLMILRVKKTHLFLCGNPIMVENVAGALEKVGYTRHTKKAPGALRVEGW